MNTPTITQLTTSPYVRYRVQLASQSEYGASVFAAFDQSARSWFTSMSAAYNGSTPATWDLTLPDFSSVAGWNNLYGLQTGSTNFNVSVNGAGAPPVSDVGADGTSFKMAGRSSSGTASLMAGSSPRPRVTPWIGPPSSRWRR